jgi:hypothetical protein
LQYKSPLKSLFAILIVAVFLSSCKFNKANTDRYYTDHGDWDDVRFPLIKPYEALCLNGSNDWCVQLTQDSKGLFSAPGTRKVNIVNRFIFLYSTKTILNFADAKEAWFVLIPDKQIEKGFATHNEYLNYLHELHITNEPKLYEMDQVSRYFANRDTIDWQRIDK